MNWLWANKEWVFSGIGVVFLGLLARILLRPRAVEQSGTVSADRNGSVTGSPVASGSNISQTVNIITTTHSSATPPTKVYSEKPTPDEIHAHLDSLPVFLRKAAKDSYVGLKVCWPVSLRNLREIPATLREAGKTDHTHTLVTGSQDHGQEIEADINIEQFPRLKISHKGTRLRILGTISHLGTTGFTYTLDDAEIEFEE